MQFIFLFHLNLIFHACKILFRCYKFEILNFETKQAHVFLPGHYLTTSVLVNCKKKRKKRNQNPFFYAGNNNCTTNIDGLTELSITAPCRGCPASAARAPRLPAEARRRRPPSGS